MKKIVFLSFIIVLIGFNCSRKTDQTPIPLNLSDEKQQVDFKNYLEGLLNLLKDSSSAHFFQGYNLSKISDDDKSRIASNMLRDQNFMSKLNKFTEYAKYVESKYKVSTFTKEQLHQIARFGVKSGIYFLPGLKEKVRVMEEKALAKIRNNDHAVNVALPCCVCSDQVQEANEQLAWDVAELTVYCLGLAVLPPAAAFCFSGVTAYFLEENDRINSNEYWCECMVANYGYCVY